MNRLIEFGPPKNGSLWPYVVLPLVGVGVMIYLTIDLYALLSQSGGVHPNDWPFLWVMVGVTGLFVLMAVVVWYAPWSWAHLRLSETEVTIEITGLNARKATQVLWSELLQVTIVTLPRRASFHRLEMRDLPAISIRTLALTADPPEVLAAFDTAARHAGYHPSGKPLAEPLIGRRRWQVLPAS